MEAIHFPLEDDGRRQCALAAATGCTPCMK